MAHRILLTTPLVNVCTNDGVIKSDNVCNQNYKDDM